MSYTLKLFGRYFAVGYDKGEWFSIYTYRTEGVEQDEWVSFLALTWTNRPETNRCGKIGWFIER